MSTFPDGVSLIVRDVRDARVVEDRRVELGRFDGLRVVPEVRDDGLLDRCHGGTPCGADVWRAARARRAPSSMCSFPAGRRRERAQPFRRPLLGQEPEALPAVLPVGDERTDHGPELAAVTRMRQVAELVNDDVVDALDGGADQVEPQRHAARGRHAAPARAHALDAERRARPVAVGKRRPAHVESLGEDGARPAHVPGVHELGHALGRRVRADRDPELAPVEAHSLGVARLDPAALDRQPVLAPQVEVQLAVDVAARRRAHGPLGDVALPAEDPLGVAGHPCRDVRLAGAARRAGDDDAVAADRQAQRPAVGPHELELDRARAVRGTSGSPASRVRAGARRASRLAPLHVARPAVDRGVTGVFRQLARSSLSAIQILMIDCLVTPRRLASRSSDSHHPDGEVDVDALLLLVGSAMAVDRSRSSMMSSTPSSNFLSNSLAFIRLPPPWGGTGARRSGVCVAAVGDDRRPVLVVEHALSP